MTCAHLGPAKCCIAETSRLQLALNLPTVMGIQTKDHKWKVQNQCYFLLANLCLTRTCLHDM